MDDELSAEERELLTADDRSDEHFGYGAATVVALALAAGVTLLTQTVLSIRYGVWPRVTLADGLSFVGIDPGPVARSGADKIIAWLLAWPLWVILFVLALAGVVLVTRHDRRPVSDALRVARTKRARQPSPPDS